MYFNIKNILKNNHNNISKRAIYPVLFKCRMGSHAGEPNFKFFWQLGHPFFEICVNHDASS